MADLGGRSGSGLAGSGFGVFRPAKNTRHLKRGGKLHESGYYDDARLEFMHVVRSDPDNIEALGALARIGTFAVSR